MKEILFCKVGAKTPGNRVASVVQMAAIPTDGARPLATYSRIVVVALVVV